MLGMARRCHLFSKQRNLLCRVLASILGIKNKYSNILVAADAEFVINEKLRIKCKTVLGFVDMDGECFNPSTCNCHRIHVGYSGTRGFR